MKESFRQRLDQFDDRYVAPMFALLIAYAAGVALLLALAWVIAKAFTALREML